MIARVLLLAVLLGMFGLVALLWGIPVQQFPGEPELNDVDADAVLVVFAGTLLVGVISLIFGLVARRSGWTVRGLFFVVSLLAVLRAATVFPLLQG